MDCETSWCTILRDLPCATSNMILPLTHQNEDIASKSPKIMADKAFWEKMLLKIFSKLDKILSKSTLLWPGDLKMTPI